MHVAMAQSPKFRSVRSRYLFAMQHYGYLGCILDPDFDNDNEEPITAEPLDWCQSHTEPAPHTD